MLAGQVISPTKLPGTFGPRITDGQTTTASVGGPVTFGYGFFPTGSTVVYLGICIEHSSTTSSGAKGGPTSSQTTYSYTQSIGVGLCEGPIDNVYRIWENGELVYDARLQQDGETDTAYSQRITANAVYAATFVLYKGTEIQNPDPTWEADKGVGNAPAHRGLAYIMYPDRKLRDDQGQRHPTFKFEVHVGLPAYETGDVFVPADLETIITAICGRCGYDTPTQIDASDMADVTVGGYAIQSVMAGRDALGPLRSVGLFDCVESGVKLKYVKRGGAPLRTLDLTDLGVYDDPGNADPAAAIQVVEQQEVELPRSIRVSYLSTDTDYQAGLQLSPSRYDTDAVNDVDVQLAVCISDTFAKQLAQILWNDAWQSRYTYTTTVDQSNADIEPSDVLIVPMDDDLVRVRVDKVNDASQIMRALTLISDDDGAYVSTAVADPTTLPPQTSSTLSGTILLLMNLPALQDADNDAGFYAVAYGDGTGNRWTGAQVHKSSDGDTFAAKATISGSPPLANLLSNLGPGVTTTWDDENYIDVTMIKGDFESRTDASLFTGANAVAIGADGRWEIVQFGVATPMTDTGGAFIRLSHLLRGRRGTESFVGTGLAGDMVVGVSMGNVFRIAMQNSEIGAPLVYKAITTGAAYASGVDQTFTGTGLCLKPFSPTMAQGRLSGSDLVITWLRRNRLGQELMSGVEIPMSETVESYVVEILSGGSPAVVRTLTSSTPTVTYTSSQITADFGSAQPSYDIRIYQISAAVGRGYPEEATVP